jgi:glycosyltransferase involved in cell wall biosynthesis
MRIAQVAPLYERVPPLLYGGTERVVSYLTEELVRLGHDVTLFASGDSITRARLVPCSGRSLRLDKSVNDPLAHHFVQLEKVFARAADFDVVHFHIDYLHYPFSQRQSLRHLTTLHGKLDMPDLQSLYKVFCDIPVVSISNAQRRPLPNANWQGTVHHGLPLELYKPISQSGDYLVFLGRVSPEKRLDRAIDIAKRCHMPLKVAAKVDQADLKYFERSIKPLLDEPLLDWIGEVGENGKQDLLAQAHALLFPIDWPEPFGLVLVEAMACGTPVVAYRSGSVPELVDEGVTGFIVDDITGAVEAVKKVARLDRNLCRRRFEERFSAERMARDYLKIYERLLPETQNRTISSVASYPALNARSRQPARVSVNNDVGVAIATFDADAVKRAVDHEIE